MSATHARDAEDSPMVDEIARDQLAVIVGRKVAARLLEAFGSVHQVAAGADPELLAAGLPPGKLRMLRAAIEVGRRSLGDISRGRRCGSGADVFEHYRGHAARPAPARGTPPPAAWRALGSWLTSSSPGAA